MNEWWITPLVRRSIRDSVRRELGGVWLRGPLPREPLSRGGVILAPNHHSWWDGYLLSELAASLGQPCAFLMNARQLGRFPFLRLVGARPPGELRSLVQRAKKGDWVFIFPEAEIRPQGRVEQVHPGAAWLARQAGVPLLPVAVRVVMRGSQRPEAFLKFGEPCQGPELQGALNTLLAELDADLLAAHPDDPPAGYLRWMGGRRSRHDRVDLPSRLLARLAGMRSRG